MWVRELGNLLDQPDPEIASAPDLMRAIIDRSSREAADVYRLAWRFSAKTLRDAMIRGSRPGGNASRYASIMGC